MNRPLGLATAVVATVVAGAASVALLSGCAIVTSTKIPQGDDASFGDVGIPYLLPKALLPLEVVVNGASLRVDLLEPVYVGDASQPYALRYAANPFSSDTVKITVDPTTSLLKTLSLESKDETGEVLKKAIATLRAESAAGTGETVLFQTVLDPGDQASINSVNTEVSRTLTDYVIRQKKACAITPKAEGCADINALPLTVTSTLTVALMAPAKSAADASTAGKSVDCSVGVCFRGTAPYRVSIAALGQTRSTLIHLPNHGPVMALPLSGHAFVTTKHTVALRNGMLESYEITKPSSALAMVSWPIDVYDAIVSTTAKIVQLKIDTSRSSVSLEEQLLAEAKKRKEIEDELAKLRARPESAGLIDMGKTRTILTVGTGKPPSALPRGVKDGGGNPIPGVGTPTPPALPANPGTIGK